MSGGARCCRRSNPKEPLMMSAPLQEDMVVPKAFDEFPEGLMVKQTMKGCLRNCLGCQSTTEYKVSNLDWEYLNSPMSFKEAHASQKDKLYILEDSMFLARCCWRDGRPLAFNVSEGEEAGGEPVLQYTKPCGMPLYCTINIPIGGGGSEDEDASKTGEVLTFDCPCCCMLPSLTAIDADKQELSKSEYLCDMMSMCVPKLMYSEGATPVYYLAPDTCCGGCCVRPQWRGCRKVSTVPFYLRDPITKEKLVNANGKHPKISKVYSGMKKECCSSADTFATMWPDDCDAKRKAGLLGLTLLLDFTVFEKQGAAGGDHIFG